MTPLASCIDWLGKGNRDPLVLRALGLIFSGALVLGWAGMRLIERGAA